MRSLNSRSQPMKSSTSALRHIQVGKRLKSESALPIRCRSESKSSLAPVSRLSVLRISFIENLVDFFVRGLRKIFVPEPNGLEGLGRAEADDVNALAAEVVAGLRCCDRNGDDDRSWPHFFQRGDSGAHRRSGG